MQPRCHEPRPQARRGCNAPCLFGAVVEHRYRSLGRGRAAPCQAGTPGHAADPGHLARLFEHPAISGSIRASCPARSVRAKDEVLSTASAGPGHGKALRRLHVMTSKTAWSNAPVSARKRSPAMLSGPAGERSLRPVIDSRRPHGARRLCSSRSFTHSTISVARRPERWVTAARSVELTSPTPVQDSTMQRRRMQSYP